MKIFVFVLFFLISFDVKSDERDVVTDRQTALEAKIDKVEKEFDLFSRNLLKSSANASRDRGQTASPEIFLDQIQLRIDRLEQNIQNYVDKIEKLNNRIDVLDRKLGKMDEDYKVRFQLLEKSRTPVVAEGKAKLVSKSIPQLKPPTVFLKKPEELYKEAHDMIKRGDYKEAENNLKIIITKHPKHNLVSNAMYWLGETYYVRGDYRSAIATFANTLKRYGEAQKGPDNLLKLGLSFKALKRNREACTAFINLPIKYPKASKDILNRGKKEANYLNCGKQTTKN